MTNYFQINFTWKFRQIASFINEIVKITSKLASKLAKSANPPLLFSSTGAGFPKGSSSSSLPFGGGGREGAGAPPAPGGGGLLGGGGLFGPAAELFGGRAGVGLSPESGLGAIGGGSSS